VSGAAAARVLRDLGARVTVADASEERAEPLRAEGLRWPTSPRRRRAPRWW
jgi:flavin-dependent dehydrogenase